MILKHINQLVIQEDTELGLLRACWNGSRNPQVFREAAGRFIDLAQQQGTQRLLLELNELPDVPVYDQLWLSTMLLSRTAQLSVNQLVIILDSQRIYNRHLLESLLNQYQSRIRIDIQFFAQAEPALDWLTDNSPRVPELLVEWQHAMPQGPGLAAPRQRSR